ncbi:hypothetical protein A9Q73_12515 [Bermanella sp. 47_1433_sub80_T6]|nr:hypothetical protein A9Q73_12515 [Bermanella sp. 47_1433_sub80_T6]
MVEFTDGKSIIESGFLAQVATDYAVFANGEYFYQLGKGDIDTVQKYHIDNPQIGYYENDGYSLREAGDTSAANPHNIIFLKDENNTAIITRYGSTESWVVNLNAQSSDNFIIAKLDLSHHTTPVSDTDNVPEAHMAFISNGKLFITLQNLANWAATENAMVAVFDTISWEEIDTNSNLEGVQGISLSLKNHQTGAIYNNKIYLGSLVYASWGSNDPNTGGIEVINTSTLESSIATDQFAVTSIAVNGQGKVFFADYADWENSSLYILNSDYSYNLVSNDLSAINITTLASPGDNSLWIGTTSFDSENQILRLDSELDYSEPRSIDDAVLSKVTTALKPVGIAFLDTDQRDLPASE